MGDFSKALKKVYEEYKPDRILIEPSGVGKLSDVIRAVESAHLPDTKINTYTAVVDAGKCKMYMKNFGEFFNDQIETASCIVFSHVDVTSAEKLEVATKLVKERNGKATVVTTDWNTLDGKEILAAMEHADTLEAELEKLSEEEHHDHHHEHHHHDHEHEHHHDDDDGECCCGHNHHHDEEHEHHHDHEHEHHHDHEHHHHHADEVFTSWGVETSKKFTESELKSQLSALTDAVRFGTVLRAKGIVPCECGKWLHFDYIPGQIDIRKGGAAYTGRLCVIGAKIDEEELKELFGV